MPIITQYELKKLRKIACEAVRRGVGFDDWMDDTIPRLVDRGEEPAAATALASDIWRIACEADQGAGS